MHDVLSYQDVESLLRLVRQGIAGCDAILEAGIADTNAALSFLGVAGRFDDMSESEGLQLIQDEKKDLQELGKKLKSLYS